MSGKFISKIKNVNYETKNKLNFKENNTSEIHGAIGYLSKLQLIKDNGPNGKNLLSPKIFLRYAPGTMRKESDGSRLTTDTAFAIDRSNENFNMEKGLSAAIGFDFEINERDKKFEFSVGQVINDKENKNMSSVSSLNDKLSDLVGSSNLQLNENLSLKYNFSLDQNYNDLNYNEIETVMNFNNLNLNFNYLQEKNILEIMNI